MLGIWGIIVILILKDYKWKVCDYPESIFAFSGMSLWFLLGNPAPAFPVYLDQGKSRSGGHVQHFIAQIIVNGSEVTGEPRGTTSNSVQDCSRTSRNQTVFAEVTKLLKCTPGTVSSQLATMSRAFPRMNQHQTQR
jgi:hypothetical protein